MRLALVGLAAVLAVAACSPTKTIGLDEILVEARPDANGNSALAVDVVMILEPGIADQIAKLPAADWFKRRAQFRRDYPDGIEVLSWELVPGQTTRTKPDRNVLDAFVFVGYATPGDHRERLGGKDEEVRILLEASGFVVEPLAKRSGRE